MKEIKFIKTQLFFVRKLFSAPTTKLACFKLVPTCKVHVLKTWNFYTILTKMFMTYALWRHAEVAGAAPAPSDVTEELAVASQRGKCGQQVAQLSPR